MNDLFIGGGGFNGIMFIGALEYLHNNELLDIKRFYGCSIGCLIGILYITGNKPKDIFNFLLDIDLKNLIKYDISNVNKDNCLLNDDLFDKLIEKIPSEIITMKDFSDTYNTEINIHTTNITDNKYNIFNNIDTPYVNIRDAIKASMSIPFLFKPVEINSKLHIDGCCKNRFGSPPSNIYIRGYSIIFIPPDNNNYFSNVLYSIVENRIPYTKYLITCSADSNVSKYLNLNSLNKKYCKELYLKGIKQCGYFLE